MRIGIDARTILNPEKGDAIGAGHYTYQLIRHLLDIDKENEYVIFFDFRAREKDIRKFTRTNVKIKFYPFSDYKKYLPGAYSEILGMAMLRKEKLDILHSTSPHSRIPFGYRGKTIVTFHSLAAYKIPESLPKIRRVQDKMLYKLMVAKADRIITVSEALRNDLKKYLNVTDEKIEIIHSGLDKRFFENFLDEREEEKVLKKYGIEKKYILFLGTLEPSKNITRLLQSFAAFKEKYLSKSKEGGKKFDWQLVLAGKKGWLSGEYQQIAKDLGLAKDVVYTRYIIGDELVPLFRGAEFFVMPSLYEGFGTTVLEAFATGTPAIISDVSSLPEIAGKAARIVNPVDKEEISEAMLEFSLNEALRNSYRQKGLEQAKKFDWEKCARETLEVYKQFQK